MEPKAKPKAIFVFPVFNEAENVPVVLQDLNEIEKIVGDRASSVGFLFVDDGSTDGTTERLQASGRSDLTVLRHPQNRGPGAAFQTAFSHLMENQLRPDDYVVTLEGDATSNPALLTRMFQRAEEGDGIVLASPYHYGGGFSEVQSWRIVLSHIANGLTKMLLNIRGLHTFSCFFRLYRGSALAQIYRAYDKQIVTLPGFECAAEILLKAVRCGVPVSEVPFQVDWGRRKGKSKMRTLKTTFGYFKMFLRFSRAGKMRAANENSNRGWSQAAVH